MAIGFLDANANGSGSTDAAITYNNGGDEIWYSGSAGTGSGSVAVGQAPTRGPITITTLKRDYQFTIDFVATPASDLIDLEGRFPLEASFTSGSLLEDSKQDETALVWQGLQNSEQPSTPSLLGSSSELLPSVAQWPTVSDQDVNLDSDNNDLAVDLAFATLDLDVNASLVF